MRQRYRHRHHQIDISRGKTGTERTFEPIYNILAHPKMSRKLIIDNYVSRASVKIKR
jgi:hypothetical protein